MHRQHQQLSPRAQDPFMQLQVLPTKMLSSLQPGCYQMNPNALFFLSLQGTSMVGGASQFKIWFRKREKLVKCLKFILYLKWNITEFSTVLYYLYSQTRERVIMKNGQKKSKVQYLVFSARKIPAYHIVPWSSNNFVNFVSDSGILYWSDGKRNFKRFPLIFH